MISVSKEFQNIPYVWCISLEDVRSLCFALQNINIVDVVITYTSFGNAIVGKFHGMGGDGGM